MEAALTPGQYLDWVRVHQQINLAPNREDLLWGLQRAEFLNANMGEDGSPIINPMDVMPYVSDDERYGDDLDIEDMVAKISTAPLFGAQSGPTIPRPAIIEHLMKLAK